MFYVKLQDSYNNSAVYARNSTLPNRTGLAAKVLSVEARLGSQTNCNFCISTMLYLYLPTTVVLVVVVVVVVVMMISREYNTR